MNVAAMVVACWAMAAPVTTKDPLKDEMKRFQGRWMPVCVETEGKTIPPEGLEDLEQLEVLVDGDKVVLKEEGTIKESWSVTFRIDPTKAPRTIDLSVSVQGSRPKTARGIYRLDGDTLTICILPPTKEPERPTEFVTKPGSRNLLWTFKRKE